MSRKRLSKKQLRRDRFVEQTFDWAHWIETHRIHAIGAVAVVVLLLGALLMWRQMTRSAEETASVEYLKARQAYFAGNWQLAASDLQAFLSRYGGSSYADDAAFFVADAYFQAGQHPQAVQALETFLDEHEGSPFERNARMMAGAAYLELGQYDQALAAYRKSLEDAESDAEKIVVRQAMALAYRAQGDREAAANQYRAIAELDTDGPKGRLARRELAEITVQPISVTGPPSSDGGSTAP